MNIESSAQTYPAKQFFLGLVIGVCSDLVISVLLSNIPGLVEVRFLDFFYNNNANMFKLGLSMFFIHLILFIVLLLVVQKRFHEKVMTIGAASGFIASMILTAMIVPQLIK